MDTIPNVTNEISSVLSDHNISTADQLKEALGPSTFVVIPMCILEDKRLSANTKLIYGEISALSRQSGSCYATDKYMAEKLGISVRVLKVSLLELDKCLLIKRETERTPNGTFRKIYINIIPSIPVAQSCTTGSHKFVLQGSTSLCYQKRKKQKEIKNEIKTLQRPSVAVGVNHVLEGFQMQINPTINYGNKTQRQAAQDLIDRLGEEKVMGLIAYVASISGDHFAPVITTPYQLREKLGQLMVYHKKSTNQQPKIVSI